MPAAAPETRQLLFSAAFEVTDGGPLPDDALAQGIEDHHEHLAKLSIALTKNSGATRISIKPSIKDVGDASAGEVLDAAHGIAWAHCSKAGTPGRYVAQLYLRDEETGRVKGAPIRIYFNLEPDGDAQHDPPAASNGPSLEYVRNLEAQNIRLTTMLTSGARRTQMNEAKSQAAAYGHIDKAMQYAAAKSSLDVERIEAEGRNARKEKLWDGIVSLFPRLADEGIKRLQKGEDGDDDASTKPLDRVTGLLTGKQLADFRAAIGETRWTAFEKSEDVAGARDVLADLAKDEAKAVLAAVGEANIITISNWK